MSCRLSSALAGNTVALDFTFRNWDHDAIPVDNILLTIYDIRDNILEQKDITTDASADEEHNYRYFYVTPMDQDQIIIELSSDYHGQPILIRRALKVIKSHN